MPPAIAHVFMSGRFMGPDVLKQHIAMLCSLKKI